MSKSIRDLVPKYIREIEPYVPGKPIEEVERELGMRAIKLASNENPLGPSPRAMHAAKRAIEESNRYPDGSGYYLREALAERLEVSQENLILGGGSTELIDLAARVLLQPGDGGITSQGSFPMYYISIRSAGGRLVEVPLREDTFDLEAIARAIDARTKIIYIANPNNPTGTMFTADVFQEFLAKAPEEALVVLDEAYFEYVEKANYSRSVELVRRGRNLLVLRTFSKVYGLAGLRIGYGIGPVALLEEINKLRLPFNTSGVAQAAALAALGDVEHVRRSVESNRAGRALLERSLRAMGVRFVPSVTNFLLVDVGADAEQAAEELMKQGVIVRPMRWMGFPNRVRVTIGAPQENDRFLRELAQLLAPASGAARLGSASEMPRETS